MQKGKRARPSPAMVVAIIALVAALAGTSFAAVKLGKGAVQAKNLKSNAVTEKKIKNNAVTEKKIADGAVSLAKLGASGKSLWYESTLGNGRTALRQSGGITAAADTTLATATVVNFGQDVSKRAISVTPSLNLGSVAVEYARCLDVSCGGGLTGSPNAILVIPFDSTGTSPAINSGFLIVASP